MNQRGLISLNIMLSERRKTQRIYIGQGYAFPKRAKIHMIECRMLFPRVEGILIGKKHEGFLRVGIISCFGSGSSLHDRVYFENIDEDVH